jgi:cell division protein FtsB
VERVPRATKIRRPSIALRWAAVVALAFVGLLYYRPLRAYVETRSSLASKSAEVRSLETENRKLQARLVASQGSPAIEREARRLGFVKPGEHLYIVQGIGKWQARLRASLRRHG